MTNNNFTKILKEPIIDIFLKKYLDSNYKDEDNSEIKNVLENLIEKEKNNKREKIKLLKIIFSTKTEVMFLNYLKNQRYVYYTNAQLFLKVLKTLQEYLNIYDKEVNDSLIKFISSSSESKMDLMIDTNNEEKSFVKFKIDYCKRRKIIRKCLDSIDTIIRNICNNYKVTLHTLNCKGQLEHGFKYYKIFANKYLIDIYCNFKPRYYEKNQNMNMEKKKLIK